MITLFVPILLLLAPVPDVGFEIRLYSDAGDKCYSVAVTKAALETAPIWKDDAENPPLSARKAMKLAGVMRDKLVKSAENGRWKSVSVSLVEASVGRWYWQVNYEWQRKGISTGTPPNLRLVVLMDGTVIEPEVIEYKRR